MYTRMNGVSTDKSRGRKGLSLRKVDHCINFVEPITSVHTRNIESYWHVEIL